LYCWLIRYYLGEQLLKVDKRDGTCGKHGRAEKCTVLVQTLDRQMDRQITVGRPRQRWKDNIKTDLKEIKVDSVGWINLTQDMD
jgi:hypothetical protein